MASPSTSADLAAAMVTVSPALTDWLVILPTALMILTGAALMMIRKSIRLHAIVAIAALGAAGATPLWGQTPPQPPTPPVAPPGLPVGLSDAAAAAATCFDPVAIAFFMEERSVGRFIMS